MLWNSVGGPGSTVTRSVGDARHRLADVEHRLAG